MQSDWAGSQEVNTSLKEPCLCLLLVTDWLTDELYDLLELLVATENPFFLEDERARMMFHEEISPQLSDFHSGEGQNEMFSVWSVIWVSDDTWSWSDVDNNYSHCRPAHVPLSHGTTSLCTVLVGFLVPIIYFVMKIIEWSYCLHLCTRN